MVAGDGLVLRFVASARARIGSLQLSLSARAAPYLACRWVRGRCRSEMKAIIWDFDGTLGYREGGMFGAALLEAVEGIAPDWNGEGEGLRPYLQSGFPWHTPEKPHTHIRTAAEWWEMLYPVFERALEGVGLDHARARIIATAVRAIYTDPVRWRLFPDVTPALAELSTQGWRHYILSNHVPELPRIAEYLGLMSWVMCVHTSARIGYEKPHPKAFEHVLGALRSGAEVWMIGDSMQADVLGAEALGIKAILVRKPDPRAARYCQDLAGIVRIVNGTQQASIAEEVTDV